MLLSHQLGVKSMSNSMSEIIIALYRFVTISKARIIIAFWFNFYNMKRTHQDLNIKAPNQIYNELLP